MKREGEWIPYIAAYALDARYEASCRSWPPDSRGDAAFERAQEIRRREEADVPALEVSCHHQRPRRRDRRGSTPLGQAIGARAPRRRD